MPPRRAAVRKTTGGWSVTRPRYGFGADETWTERTHRAAIRSLDRTIPRGGLGFLPDADRGNWPTDGANPYPAWTPLCEPED